MVKGWQSTFLGNLGHFIKGRGISKGDAHSGTIPCVRYGELYTTHDYYIKQYTSYISEEVASSSVLIKNGDILFAGSGETKEDIGKCAAFLDSFRAYAGSDIVIFSPSAKVNSMFLGFLLNTPAIANQKASKGQGHTVVHISTSALAELEFLCPPIQEQTAIAEALSDADHLIASLQKLIAKKKAIKQGAMQELLTGKRRLPGFRGEWDIHPFGFALTVSHGKSQKHIEDETGKYQILATGGCIGRTNEYLWNKASILIGRKGTINKPQYVDDPFWTIDTLFYTKVHEGFSAKFLYYKFCTLDWVKHNEASGVPSLNAKTIEKIEIAFPQDKEQTAIAQVLSDMDAEIKQLEKKLAKYQQIKQGMMQELLTGRIRLVEPTREDILKHKSKPKIVQL